MSDKISSIYVNVIGLSGTGKTQFVNRYLYNTFSDEYNHTISPSFNRFEIEFEGKNYNLVVKEVPFESNDDVYKTKADSYIAVFDVSDPDFYNNVVKTIVKIRDCKNVVLFGNKHDLNPSVSEVELREKFPYELLIGSAKENINVDDVFSRAIDIATEVMSHHKEEISAEVKTKEAPKEDNEKQQSECCLLI